MANRKDSKGRVLKTGESQRKDGTYMYRYTDIRGNRKSVYASDLKELREKERDVFELLNDGVDYAKGDITVTTLLSRYFSVKIGIKSQTKKNYNYKFNIISTSDFGHRKICTIKKSDAISWIISMRDSGRKDSTIRDYTSLLKSAFQFACDDHILKENPFNFNIHEYIGKVKFDSFAMTEVQQESLMDFIKKDKRYKKYYGDYKFLLETGLRLSEFRGLTFKDIDFKNRTITVSHQLSYGPKDAFHIIEPKSASGNRKIYMTDGAVEALNEIIAKRPKVKNEVMVDGYCGFILLGNDGYPYCIQNHSKVLKSILKKYNRLHPEAPLPHITPHTFRHTFCTNMVHKGLDIKSLQYVMGHSDPSITLKVYSHVNSDVSINNMKNIVDARNVFSCAHQEMSCAH